MEKVSNDDLVGYIVLAQNSDVRMGVDRYIVFGLEPVILYLI